jgi:hypothetical protein
MRPTSLLTTGVATSAWIPVDYRQNPFNIGLAVVVGGTITYTVEHTFDDPFTGTPVAFPHSVLAAQTASKDGNYAFPVRAIRVNNTAGTGTTTITILQGQR